MKKERPPTLLRQRRACIFEVSRSINKRQLGRLVFHCTQCAPTMGLLIVGHCKNLATKRYSDPINLNTYPCLALKMRSRESEETMTSAAS